METSKPTYWQGLVEHVGQGWNRFWFTPRSAYSLCVLRIVVGLLALAWYAQLGRNLVELFGSKGLMPFSIWSGESLRTIDAPHVTIFQWLTSDGELSILFWIGGITLFLFTAGIFTRVTTVVAFLLVVSILQRKNFVILPFEDILAMVLFYLCFAPAGDELSVDAAWKSRLRPVKPVLKVSANIATRLLQIQLTAVYALMTIWQLKSEVWPSGEAIFWLSARSETRWLDVGGWKEEVINLWTLTHLTFELTFPILIWNRWLRPLALGASVVLWLILILVTGQPLFSLIMIAAGLVFVSPDWLRQCRMSATPSTGK